MKEGLRDLSGCGCYREVFLGWYNLKKWKEVERGWFFNGRARDKKLIYWCHLFNLDFIGMKFSIYLPLYVVNLMAVPGVSLVPDEPVCGNLLQHLCIRGSLSDTKLWIELLFFSFLVDAAKSEDMWAADLWLMVSSWISLGQECVLRTGKESQGASESTQVMGDYGMASGHLIGGIPVERKAHVVPWDTTGLPCQICHWWLWDWESHFTALSIRFFIGE